MITAALSGWFKKVYGVEYISKLAQAANASSEKYLKIAEKEGLPRPELKAIEGDLGIVDWSDADILFACTLCHPEPLIKSIFHKAKLMKPNSRIVTLNIPKEIPSCFKIIKCLRGKMTWGFANLIILGISMKLKKK